MQNKETISNSYN